MRKLIYILLFVGLPLSAQTTYYVKNGGNDGAAGTSDEAAWATISKVNSVSFSAGDSVLFNRGDKFIGSITISNDGTASDHIVYGAYGSGNKPIITPNDTIDGITWTQYPSNDSIYYTTDITYNPGNLLIDWDEKVNKINDHWFDTPDPYLFGKTALEILAMTADTAWTANYVPNVQFWDTFEGLYCYDEGTGTTYIRFRNGDNPNDSVLAFSEEGYSYSAVHVYYKDYITIRDLDILGGDYGVRIYGSISITIDSCDFTSTNQKMRIGSSDTIIVSNCTFQNNYLSSYSTGAWVNSSTYTDAVSYNYYRLFKYMVDVSASNRADGAIVMEGGGSDNCQFYNNTVDYCANGIDLFGDNIQCYSNTITGTSSIGLFILSEGNIYSHDNYLLDVNIGVRFGSVDVYNGSSYLYKNRIYVPDAGELMYLHSSNTGPSLAKIYAYHNSFVAVKGITYSYYLSNYPSDTSGVMLINNIISVDGNMADGWNGINNHTDLNVADYNWISGQVRGATTSTWIPEPENIWYPYGPTFWDHSSPADFTTSEEDEVINAGVDITAPFTIQGNQYAALPGAFTYYDDPDMGWYEFETGIVYADSVHIGGEGGATTIAVDNGTLQFYDTIFPANASFQEVTWSITNETGSASTDQDGLVTALTDGTVLVIGTAQDGTGEADTVQVTISNQDANTAPTVTTTLPTLVQSSIMTVHGNVTATGGAAVTERGVCWGTATNPTISGSHKAIGSGTGAFSAVIVGLSNNTLYYVRAYATNSEGTSYGSNKIIRTDAYSALQGGGNTYRLNGKTIVF